MGSRPSRLAFARARSRWSRRDEGGARDGSQRGARSSRRATRAAAFTEPRTGRHRRARRAGGDDVLGMLTLIIYRVPTGMRAWIHDVVVDETARGRRVGEALPREAPHQAADAGAISVELTTRQERDAANRLYRRLRFAQRETNVYVWRPR